MCVSWDAQACKVYEYGFCISKVDHMCHIPLTSAHEHSKYNSSGKYSFPLLMKKDEMQMKKTIDNGSVEIL